MEKAKDVRVVIATHKECLLPEDKMYLPLEVGAVLHENKLGYRTDDTGENISKLNPFFSELTGLYWAWKNLHNDYIGLVHYRRFFATTRLTGSLIEEERIKAILTSDEAEELLSKTDVILPKKRNYVVENLYDHYAHTMYVEPLEITEQIIRDKYPDYLPEFLRLHERKTAHMFNMMIMKKEILNRYCAWLFAILFELERRVKDTGIDQDYDAFHKRFYGRISELLLDVYINTQGIEYVETNVISVRPVNWVKKGGSFLKAKFIGQKYKESF